MRGQAEEKASRRGRQGSGKEERRGDLEPFRIRVCPRGFLLNPVPATADVSDMHLFLPDDIIARGELDEQEVRLALAVQLYADNRIDHADSCRLAGLAPAGLDAALLRAGLSLQQYPPVHLAGRRSAG